MDNDRKTGIEKDRETERGKQLRGKSHLNLKICHKKWEEGGERYKVKEKDRERKRYREREREKRERTREKDQKRKRDGQRKKNRDRERKRNRKGKTTKGEEPSELENMSQKMTKCFLILLIKA